MYKFNWDGNDGECYYRPKEVVQAKCGICGTQMSVQWNVSGSTNFPEPMSQQACSYDIFSCPYLEKGWHKEIVKLKRKEWNNMVHADKDLKKIPTDLEEKIKKILEDAENSANRT